MPTISERRELLLRALLEVFKERDFAVKDITTTGVWSPQLVAALEANFGKGFFKIKRSLQAIKVGRLLQTLPGTLYGHFDLQPTAYGDPNRYRVEGPDGDPGPGPKAIPKPDPPPVPTLDPVMRGREEVAAATARYQNPPRVEGKPEAPKPETVATGPTAWRQPTRAELAARHKQSQSAFSGRNSDQWFIAACAARNNRG